MIGNHHIELDGIRYRLAEDAEGQHHNIRGEPLRPPNAVTVQGESTQKFQPRPEVLLWNWTDWSGGEGLRTLKFGAEFASRSWVLDRVRVFEEPGHLIPGYHVGTTVDSGGSVDFTQNVCLGSARENLYAVSRTGGAIYQWDESLNKWGSDLGVSGVAGGMDAVVGDIDNLYAIENGAANTWYWDGGASWTALSTGTIPTGQRHLAQLGPYIYVYRPRSSTIWEISKATGAITVLDTWTESGASRTDGQQALVVLDGRLYGLVSNASETAIREFTPTTAAGEGFGAEIARFDGFKGETMWAHSGSLFILGRYQDDGSERTILYLPPGENYGTLGKLRTGNALGVVTGGSGRMLDHFFVTRQLRGADNEHALFQIDSVSGGIACLGYDEVGDVTGEDPAFVIAFKGEIFWTTKETASVHRVLRASEGRYQKDSSAISPEHDFDLVSEKFLSSLVLSCQPLPADWTVYVDYQINGSGTWVTGITYTTDNGTGTTTAITDSNSTVEFKTLQLRVRFEYTGAGNPTSAPVVLGVEARAIVATKVKVFQYLLDLSDDHSGKSQSRAGHSKVDEFQVTAAKSTSVDLKDGYTQRGAGNYDQYDVFVDDYNIVLTRPGEGIAAVTLREVI